MIPLGILAKALPFLKGLNWIRIGLITALAIALFVGGCQYANVKHAEEMADIERQKTEAISAAIAERDAEWRLRLEKEEAARAALQFDLSIIQERERDLLAQIEDAQLTRPVDDVTIEACLETEDEDVKLVIANPFSADFVRLYNDSSRAIRTGTSPGPETD